MDGINELDSKQKKEWAQQLYTTGRLTQQEIADKINVHRVTVCNWVRDGNWDKMRASFTITKDEILANWYLQITEINNIITSREPGKRVATPKEADTLTKLSSSINKLEGDSGVAEAISISKKMLAYVRQIDPGKAAELSYYFDMYIKNALING